MAALIAGGVALAGDYMAQQGQQATNAQSYANMLQSEQWQEYMSDTAMQRRVTDLRAAGLNPMLATGTPGAGMGSPVMPSLQNPSAAFGGAGGQVASALQLQSQNAEIDLLKAQANKASAETDSLIPAQVNKIQSEIGVNAAEAQKIQRNVSMMDIALTPYGGKSMYQESMENDVAQNAIKTHIAQMDQQERESTLLTAIKARNDVNFATSIGARNIASASDGAWGKFLSYFAVPGFSNAANVAGQAIRTAIP